MGAHSPENAGGSWRGGATGRAVRVVFRGRNHSGLRRWLTRRIGRLVSGVGDRADFTARSIEQTLQRVKARTELG